MDNMAAYLTTWVSRQPFGWQTSKSSSSIAWEFALDARFRQISGDVCGLLANRDESAVQALVSLTLAPPYGPEFTMMVDALKLACSHTQKINEFGVITLVVAGALVVRQLVQAAIAT